MPRSPEILAPLEVGSESQNVGEGALSRLFPFESLKIFRMIFRAYKPHRRVKDLYYDQKCTELFQYHSELFCTVRPPCRSTKMAAAAHRFT